MQAKGQISGSVLYLINERSTDCCLCLFPDLSGEVKGRSDTLEWDKWQEQSPLLLPLDLGSESADWGLPRLSIIQSASWPIGFPCLSLLLGVKWTAGTLLILISLSIRPHSGVNESVCQSDRFWCCRFSWAAGTLCWSTKLFTGWETGCWIPQFISHFMIADWKETAWSLAITVWYCRNDKCWWLCYCLPRPICYLPCLLWSAKTGRRLPCLNTKSQNNFTGDYNLWPSRLRIK